MAKRDLFTELLEGVGALRAEREGKITLRTTVVKAKPVPDMAPKEIVALRESLGYSQGVFAMMLRTPAATLRKWEQGVAKPNTQAKLLLGLVKQDPMTLQKLAII
jgi:putative transcriptional regulator